jgi:hypothetical protein
MWLKVPGNSQAARSHYLIEPLCAIGELVGQAFPTSREIGAAPLGEGGMIGAAPVVGAIASASAGMTGTSAMTKIQGSVQVAQ